MPSGFCHEACSGNLRAISWSQVSLTLGAALTGDGRIDYSTYSYRELLEALDNINSKKYPKNYKNLQIALEKIGPAQRAALERGSYEADDADGTEFFFDDPLADDEQLDPDVRRVRHLATALAVAGIGAYLLWVGDIVLPFAQPLTVSLSGLGVPIGLASFVLAITVPASFIVDVFDDRDNGKKYYLYALFAESAATGLLAFAYIVSLQS